jgi:hypothetical protein
MREVVASSPQSARSRFFRYRESIASIIMRRSCSIVTLSAAPSVPHLRQTLADHVEIVCRFGDRLAEGARQLVEIRDVRQGERIGGG